MKENKIKKSIKCEVIFSSVLTLAIILLVLIKTGIHFETNDDRYIMEILSGAMVGKPNSHTIFINYLPSIVLAGLYRITNEVPWYALYLIGLISLAYIFVLTSLFMHCQNLKKRILVTLVFLVCMLSSFYLLGQIQFTEIAAFLAISGYICLILNQKNKNRYLLFIILELLAFWLREDAMLMIQPFGILAYFISMWEEKCLFREKSARIIKIIMILFIIFIISRASNYVGYHGEEWKVYQEYNAARSKLYDYYEAPKYDEIDFILKTHNVTQIEYESYKEGSMLSEHITTEFLKETKEYLKNRDQTPLRYKLKVVMQKNRALFSRTGYNGLNYLMLLSWVFILILAVLRKKVYLISFTFGMISMFFLEISYLNFKGRLPYRVLMPLFTCQIMLMTLLLFIECENPRNKKNAKVFLVVFILIFSIIGFKTGKSQYRYVNEQNKSQNIYMNGLKEIISYCQMNNEKRYFIEFGSLIYYKGNVLETETYYPRNAVVTGTWYYKTPVMKDYIDTYFEKNLKYVYLIRYDNDDFLNNSTARYLAQLVGSDYLVEDRFETSIGMNYIVYKFKIQNERNN